ncbi:larval cuticle protein 1-like [Anopheles ziemanni]|uniref:larval cuticle protein 1-like n=1 Tax=Anopheles coustani TaxID=139045 RepID=UPI0026581DCC|nr:larval cuticle protein 1-like [Anopheles coustani]XP_058166853.1 larval cuticle protein 1-like [Anopheles ziemanni]
MKVLIVLAALVAIAACAPNRDIEVRKLDIDHTGLVDGSYSFSYDQSDDQKRDESASLKTVKNVDNEDVQALSITGQYEYTDPEGKRYLVKYIADENGFNPTITEV